MKWLALVACLLWAGVVWAQSPTPTTAPCGSAPFTITTTADSTSSGSLRWALGCCNGNTITVPAGTYTLTLGEIPIVHNCTINGAGAASTIISGNDASRILNITTSTVAIDGIAFVHGHLAPAGAGGTTGSGGAILASGTLTLTHTLFDSNTINTVCADGWDGGAVWISGQLNVDGSSFTNNQACDDLGPHAGGDGGAIFCSTGTLCQITNTAFSGNTASDGSGVYAESETLLVMTGVSFSGNTATDFNTLHLHQVDTVRLANVTFCSNTSGNAEVNNSLTVTGTFNNVTIVGNTDTAHAFVTDLGDATLSNTIIGGSCGATFGSILSAGHNIESGTSCGFTGTGDQQGTTAALGACLNNGGTPFVLTACPVPGSAALDTGNPATPTGSGGTCELTDERGIVRPQGVACDVGACEVVAVSSPSATPTGTPPTPTVTPSVTRTPTRTPTPNAAVGCCACPLMCSQETQAFCTPPCVFGGLGTVCILVQD